MDFKETSDSAVIFYILNVYAEATLKDKDTFEEALNHLCELLEPLSTERIARLRVQIEHNDLYIPGCFNDLLEIIDGQLALRDIKAGRLY
jgi:hypothetical protein